MAGKVETGNLWHVDPDVYQRAKAQVGTESIYSKGQKVPYIMIEGGKEDYRKVVDLYKHSEVPGYVVAKVDVIYNKALVLRFESEIQSLEQRDENSAFQPKWKEQTKDAAQRKLRERVDYTLKQKATEYAVANRHVSLLPMFHGTNDKLFDSIFRTGYANLATTDPGFFGKGIYNTSFAEYAWRVYSKGGLIFNWVAFFSALPVITQDMKKMEEGGLGLIGGTGYGNYDAHYALVKPQNPSNKAEKVYLPVTLADKPTYDELVVFASSQVLPRYVVYLGPVGLKVKEMDPKHNKGSLLEILGAFWKKAKPSLKAAVEKKMQVVKEKRDGEDDLTKEEEWLHDQVQEILAVKEDSDPDIQNVLIDQMEVALEVANKEDPKKPTPKKEEKEPHSPREQSEQPGPSSPMVQIPKPPPKSPLLGLSAEEKKEAPETLYQRGIQFTRANNYTEAFKAWKLAADAGHAASQYLVGQSYKLGQGVGQDYQLAFNYSLKAADQGHTEAQDYVGHCYFNGYSSTKNPVLALKYLKPAADKLNVSSCLYMAIYHRDGLAGLEESEEKAFHYLKIAADNGNVQAQYEVGQRYKLGKGVAKNFQLAIDYSLKAAGKGHRDAQEYVGHCYYNGYSAQKSFETAVQFFRPAAEQGQASAQEYLGLCFANGHGVAQSDVESAKWYKLAAEQGRAAAQYTMGIYYRDGRGVTKDLDQAKRYFKLAEGQGYINATQALAALH